MPPEFAVVAGAVGLPFAGAAVAPLAHRVLGDRTGYAGAALALGCFGLLASLVGTEGAVSVSWVPSLDLAARFYVDGWALLFALLASGIGVLVFAYSARYMHGAANLGRYYGTLLAFMGSILGVALASNLLLLFLFWELTSVASFLLIGHHSEDEASRRSARMAMLVTVGGGLFLLVGILALAAVAGPVLGGTTFDLTTVLAERGAVAAALREAGLFVPVMGLFLVAASAKSAQVPLHFWLPNAMVAPTPVSAFLHSATMVKVGVYFLGRVRPLFVGVEWTALVATVGLTTMLVGALLAVRASDSKRLLAYSTASHLGLMVAGFGLASKYGAEAGAYHLFNHALFKAALFLVAGIVAHEAGTRHLPDLGGLWQSMPGTAAVAGVTGLAMAGIPPFAGFYSKEIFFEATWEAAVHHGGLAWLYPLVATAASVLTVVYSLKFLAMFWGDAPEALAPVHRPHVALLAPPAVLGLAVLVTSLAPTLAVPAVLQPAVDATAVRTAALHPKLPTHLSGPVAMSAVAILGGMAVYPYHDRVGTAVGWVTAHPVASPTAWHFGILAGLDRVSTWIGPAVHNGLLRTYVAWAVGAASGVVLLGYLATGAAGPLVVDVPLAMALVLAVAVVAVVAVVVAPSHVAGVLSLSILGFMVAIFYILASAPDLALTQLVVETLVLLLFLLVLERLPAFYADLDPAVVARDVGVSLVVGVATFATVVVTMPGDAGDLPALARYYVGQAIPQGGGKNVVNVILTDFRALDTMGEILVISLAAISILVLVTMRTRGETR
ncbi:hydrogen gas-evolving membrane-bound hydrogenase subunit E [Halobacteriales archaeon Cl-PHB]